MCIKQFRVRVNTYKTRIKWMQKNTKELYVLCGVDVRFASFSPDLKAKRYWLNEPFEFHYIINRYKFISSQKPPNKE
ncbi:hypothetical protein M5K25_000464 [Dendrobium thyrsiflorum]|uniref:Uncharacterized protein n=1 Tax=Dendrobium thyrsiflorum TaxID=117978 RepID=A0ABD0VTP8_DENTH